MGRPSMAAAVSRADVVAEARRWIGTPFYHQQSLLGHGTDCVGLVRGIWRALIGPEPEPCPVYPKRVDLLDRSILMEHAERHLVRVKGAPQPGDVLVGMFRDADLPHHAMILSAPGRVIHAVMWSPRRVVETGMPARAIVAAAYRFPGVI